MKINVAKYVNLSEVLNTAEIEAFYDSQSKLDIGNAEMNLFSAVDIANEAERTVPGQMGKDISTKVLGIPEGVLIWV